MPKQASWRRATTKRGVPVGDKEIEKMAEEVAREVLVEPLTMTAPRRTEENQPKPSPMRDVVDTALAKSKAKKEAEAKAKKKAERLAQREAAKKAEKEKHANGFTLKELRALPTIKDVREIGYALERAWKKATGETIRVRDTDREELSREIVKQARKMKRKGIL